MAQQENAPNKPVHLIYLCGRCSVLFAAVDDRLDLGLLRHAPSEFKISLVAAIGATVVGIVLYRNDRYLPPRQRGLAELKKVTWPTAKEVRSATIVVIVMAIISALILGLFDFVWSNVTELVYGG